MKNCLVFLFAIFAVLTIAKAYDGCRHDGRVLKVGETFQEPGKCELKTCNAQSQISVKICPEVASLYSNKHIQDLSKPYPECC